MDSRHAYEEHILKALRSLPQSALTEVRRLIMMVRDQYLPRVSMTPSLRLSPQSAHHHTRELLQAAQSNWAQDMIRDRGDRL